MGMQERYRVTCDTPNCQGRGPWRESDDLAQVAAEQEIWTWEEDKETGECRDLCPSCRFGNL